MQWVCMQLHSRFKSDMTPDMQVLRRATVMALGNEGTDVDVQCSDSSLGEQDMISVQARPSADLTCCCACIAILSLLTDAPLLSIDIYCMAEVSWCVIEPLLQKTPLGLH